MPVSDGRCASLRVEGVCVQVGRKCDEARRRLEERRRAGWFWGGGCEVAGTNGTARCQYRAKGLEAHCLILAGPTRGPGAEPRRPDC